MNVEKINKDTTLGSVFIFFIIGGLYLVRSFDQTLFHNIIELISVFIAFGIFVVIWNGKKYIDTAFFIILGIAYLFVGLLDLGHAFSVTSKIFSSNIYNIASQFRISARYFECLSFLFASFYTSKRIKITSIIMVYSSIFLIVVISIIYWQIFPVCFVAETGDTLFRKISEVVIAVIIIITIYILQKNKKDFSGNVLKLIILSLVFNIASEIVISFYYNPDGSLNMMGHLLKILSVYFIYEAIIENVFRNPYDIIFRQLNKSKEELQEQKEFAEKLIETAQVIILVLDTEGRIRLFNSHMEELSGYSRNEMIGKSWFEYFLPDQNKDKIHKVFLNALAGNQTKGNINPIITKDGREIMVEWHDKALKDADGHTVGLLVIGQDVTQRLKAEELSKKINELLENEIKMKSVELARTQDELSDAKRLSDLGILSASIAHEIRNPLTVMKASVYNVRKKLNDDSLDKHLARIDAKINESEMIINNLLTFTKKPKLVYEKVICNEIINECLESAKNKFIKWDVRVELSCNCTKDDYIMADRINLIEIYSNIIDNAYQAMIDKKGVIRINGKFDHQNNIFNIIFKDNGKGIAKEDIDKIYEPFFTKKVKGIGLGLSVCKKLLELYGGSIQIASSEGNGAEVRLSIPIDPFKKKLNRKD